MKKIKNFINKLLGFLFVSVICFAPTEGYLLAKYLFEPNGFWANLFLAGLAIYIGGPIQFLLFILWLALTFYFWSPKYNYQSNRSRRLY